MNSCAHEKRAGAMASPPGSVLTANRSELVNVGHAKDPRVELDRACGCATYRGVSVDVDIADIGAQGALGADRHVKTGMQGNTPGIVEFDRGAVVEFFIPEMRIVQTNTDKRGHDRVVGEMVLDRDGGRQVFCRADITGPLRLKVMFERPGRENLNADIVHDEVFKRQRRADVFADAGRGRGAEAVGRIDVVRAEADGHIALLLSKCRSGGRGQKGGEGEGCYMFHGLSTLVLTGAGMRAFWSNHFDVYQVAERLPRCGEIATGGACPAQMRETATCN